MLLRFPSAAAGIVLAAASAAAQPAAVPALASRPGAPYTLYLNFTGFSFSGTWGYDPNVPDDPVYSPGVTPAFDTDGNAAGFSATELRQIRETWSRTAESYATLNVNVTTIDPAAANPGTTPTDANRQAYYDATPHVTQTVIGGAGGWLGVAAGGVSNVAVIGGPANYNGEHTNFVFPANLGGGYPQYVALAAAHEDGHAFGLLHQGSGTPGTRGYSPYDPGDGVRGPVMGAPYGAARALWRVGGPSGVPAGDTGFGSQNDLALILANPNIAGAGPGGFVRSPAGSTPAAAATLAFAGTAIDYTRAKGVITPNGAPTTPRGEANYTADYFRFTVPAGGRAFTVVLNAGVSTLDPGTPDPGATLDGTLRLFGPAGLVAESKTTSLSETISTTSLPEGDYYLQIASAGGDDRYFDIGSYFLTGTLGPVPVPEPGLALLAAAAALGVRASARVRVRV